MNIEQSDPIAELAGALLAAQKEFTPVRKSKKGSIELKNGGRYEYNYADLEGVLRMVFPVLHDNGLVLTQFPIVTDDGKGGLATQLIHKSGQWIRATMGLTVTQTTAQGMGSAISYARRYSIGAVLGIVTTTDDDGAVASSEGSKGTTKREPPKGRETPATAFEGPLKILRENIRELDEVQKERLNEAWVRELLPSLNIGLSDTEIAIALSLVSNIKKAK